MSSWSTILTPAAQYTSDDFTQILDDHEVLASIGTVGDALDNVMAESFVDTFKTELIRDRVWRTNSQMELAVVEWIGWYNPSGCTAPSATSHPPNTNRTSISTPSSTP